MNILLFKALLLIAHYYKHLGFNHMSFHIFFLLSQHSHLNIFQFYVVVI
nr:MAG TPA: hypothetical protein [Caudoviricetes sp.]